MTYSTHHVGLGLRHPHRADRSCRRIGHPSLQ